MGVRKCSARYAAASAQRFWPKPSDCYARCALHTPKVITTRTKESTRAEKTSLPSLLDIFAMALSVVPGSGKTSSAAEAMGVF